MLKYLPENLIEQALTEWRNSDVPVFILGTGQTAGKIKQYIDHRGGEIDGFLLNRKYWREGTERWQGCPVYVAEEYLAEHTCRLIVGFSGYQEDMLEGFSDHIEKLYALDFIGALCLEGEYSMISHAFYQEHKESLDWLEKHLCDEESQKALEQFILQRMTGVYAKETYDKGTQYFPDSVIRLEEGEVFVDCGAYHGESSIDFICQLEHAGIKNYRKIVCVEADGENAEEIKKVLKEYKNVEIIHAGVWDKAGVLHMNAGYGVGSRLAEDGADTVTVAAIDEILQGEEATYIKMDVEGAELRALYGAEKTIRTYRPKLAVCMYHKPEDLVTIPQYIYSIRDDYRFYIRNHSPYGIEMVLYAV